MLCGHYLPAVYKYVRRMIGFVQKRMEKGAMELDVSRHAWYYTTDPTRMQMLLLKSLKQTHVLSPMS
jgi:hypothetical protein